MAASNTETATRAIWQRYRARIEELFAEMWAEPEMPAMEYASMARLAEFLERNGFAVERGAGGVPTAFKARSGNGKGPRIGILAEYDALPSLDNEAVPYRKGSGRKPGHGCGHNHIGPANTGAGIAAAAALAELGLDGEIIVVGCPAEEIGWGKLALQDAGVFDELDVILTSHGDYQNGSLARPCHGVASGEFRFTGDSAHGGMGTTRNALAAAEAAIAAFEAKRSEADPDLQFKHIFRVAGVAPGVMPEEVRVWCSVRHLDFDRLTAGYDLMHETFEEIAEVENVGFSAHLINMCRGYLGNDTIGHVLAEALEVIGPPAWSEDDIAFMTELSANSAPGTEFDLHRELDYFDTGVDYYGQDDGDVSWAIPLGRVNWAYPKNVPIHHWAWTALSGHSASTPGPMMASEALALGAVALAQQPELIDGAKAELARRTEGQTIAPPRYGARAILTTDPAAFWDASWTA
ncbi:aminobenzoyl-glutamate utilization protein B [Devosia pacifica]|uniref:Aminobenzoyl-glutamate utilization protein B n=1 Tax=Devosia pacifica TaxID=1335967 RepID=A0A918RXZ3_9HYPH|nr:peptidase dimerization domain-containing protein [Devosia pacifica]GHA13671.1 aminobenzoyl-glutamate utilization protein B [Devosia pacifica]